MIYRLAYSYVKNTEDSLDIVQDSIYKAFSSIDSLKSTASMFTLITIGVNTSPAVADSLGNILLSKT